MKKEVWEAQAKEEGRFAVLIHFIYIYKVSQANGKKHEFHECKKVEVDKMRRFWEMGKEVAMIVSVFHSLTSSFSLNKAILHNSTTSLKWNRNINMGHALFNYCRSKEFCQVPFPLPLFALTWRWYFNAIFCSSYQTILWIAY